MKKLLERLILGQRLPATIDSEALFLRFSEPPEPFFSTEELRSSADRILERILRALALEKMPTEYDVSREIVFNLSSHCMTGQTLYPTGGLALEQLAVAGEFSGYYSDELYKTLKAPSVTIIGDAMYEEMAHVAACLYKASGVGKILILTASSPGQEKILLELSKRTIGPDSRLIIKHSSIEAIAQESDLLISFPMSTLPAGDDWQQLPNITLFKDLIETHLTNHFQVAKRGALIDKCRVFFVTHPSSNKDGTVLKALSQFFATSVAALTATVGQECQRICHKAQFIQLNACGYGNKEAYLENLQNALLILSNRDQRETRQSKPGRIFSLTDGFK